MEQCFPPAGDRDRDGPDLLCQAFPMLEEPGASFTAWLSGIRAGFLRSKFLIVKHLAT